MTMVIATTAEKNIRIPPRAEGMTVAVIGTLSRAGIDGETMTLEFAVDIVRHGEAHIVLEVDLRLSISASYRNILGSIC